MALIRRLNYTEIEGLCDNVLRDLMNPTTESENRPLILLRRVCGKNKSGCTNLVPSQELSYLLSLLRNCDVLFDYDVGHSIINSNILAHLSQCQSALECILRHSLNDSPSHKRNMFLEKLWTNPALTLLNTDAIAEFMLHESKYIEEDIFSTFKAVLEKGLEPEWVWSVTNSERVVSWSSNSSRIFCIVTSVLNTWLQKIVGTVKHYEASVSVVSAFINQVRMKCADHEIDFVLLYPSKCHSLVSLLVLRPDFFPTIPLHAASVTLSTVLEHIKENLKNMQCETLCLLTHFPEWSPYISR